MLHQFYQIFSQKIQPLYSQSKWARALRCCKSVAERSPAWGVSSKAQIALLLLVLCTSCFSPKSSEVRLNLSVQPTSRPGVYNALGSTNLPDQSQITVTALRYLFPKEQQFLAPDPKTTYSILDRQIVKVAKGKWQATLNLWQVAPDGRLREAWQLNQSQTGLLVNPAPEVSFLATFAPVEQSWKLGQQLNKTNELRGSLVRFTNEGQPYVQANQTLAIALPIGRKPPPKLQPEDINGGWGNRYEIKPEPPVASSMRPQPLKTDQIDAPLSPSEFLR
jgi:hypothetical protein